MKSISFEWTPNKKNWIFSILKNFSCFLSLFSSIVVVGSFCAIYRAIGHACGIKCLNILLPCQLFDVIRGDSAVHIPLHWLSLPHPPPSLPLLLHPEGGIIDPTHYTRLQYLLQILQICHAFLINTNNYNL